MKTTMILTTMVVLMILASFNAFASRYEWKDKIQQNARVAVFAGHTYWIPMLEWRTHSMRTACKVSVDTQDYVSVRECVWNSASRCNAKCDNGKELFYCQKNTENFCRNQFRSVKNW